MFAETQEKPWPDDMIVSGVEIQLVPDDSGDLLGEKSQTLDNVAPTEYSPAAYPQYAERTFEFRRMELGMGLKRQVDGFPRAVYYDLGIDGSIGGTFGLGPKFHQQDGVTGAAFRDRAIGRDGSVDKEFGAFGQYVAVRDSDLSSGWTVIGDFGAGRTVLQLARFMNQGVNPIDAVYAVLDNGDFWQYDGSAWNACSLPTGFLPTAVCVVNDEMFLCGGGELRSVNADPLIDTNYSGAVFVGEVSAPTTWLAGLHGMLFVFKEDGVYSVSGLGGTLEVTDLTPEFRYTRNPTNGVGAKAWNDALWFRWGDTLWKATSPQAGGIAQFEPVGLSILMENDSEVRGYPIGLDGHNNWFGYFVVVDDTDSYLCKWGSWLNPRESNPQQYLFAEVPHGALAKWTGKVATRVWVSPIAGTDQQQRLYVGFEDGTTEYTKLPRHTPSPFQAGSGCEFVLTGQRYAPEIDCDWPAESKSWRAVTAFAPSLDATRVMRYFYRDSDQVAWTEFTDQFTSNTQRRDFPSNFGSKRLQQYVQLETADENSSPTVEGWGLHYSVVPAVILEYAGAADARLYRVRRDGSVDERDPNIIRQAILTAVGVVGAVACTLPDGSQRELNFFRYSEALQRKWQRVGREWIHPFRAIEFRSITVYGTHRRMEAYTHGQLEGFGSHTALETI